MLNAYCGECKAKKEIGNARPGILTLEGECLDCGARMRRVAPWGLAFVFAGLGLLAAVVFLLYGIIAAALLCTLGGFAAVVRGVLIRTAENGSRETELDLRHVDLSSKYAVGERGFLYRWAALRPGETLRIVTDRDPKPLYHHVNGDDAERFEWECERYGTGDWVVSLRKL